MSSLHTGLKDTIVALATANGIGAISVIRLSGERAIEICNKVFKGKDLEQVASHTVHFGTIRSDEKIIDEVLVSVFKAPNSYTKENTVEISCHGSNYIVNQIIQLLIKNGAVAAKPGEFTFRAFINGGLDLSQAEAVADLISSSSAASHQIAMQQMRGGFSNELKKLREELIHFASLVELELDFSEEDVEFANRDQMRSLIEKILKVLRKLIQSFELGNVIKKGVPVVIAGKPNVGKSTLLNALLNEERAIVSDIAGTTRDTVEDEINIQGINFRFIDTAGIRDTEDIIEAKGVEKTFEKIQSSAIVIYLFDAAETNGEEFRKIIADLLNITQKNKSQLIIVANKADRIAELKNIDLSDLAFNSADESNIIQISALQKQGITEIEERLLQLIHFNQHEQGEIILTNIRHVEALQKSSDALTRVLDGIDNPVTSDFLAMDIKESLHYLGEITGAISTDDLLDNIFSKFCIGK
jgi:tRNA modification GTPase